MHYIAISGYIYLLKNRIDLKVNKIFKFSHMYYC